MNSPFENISKRYKIILADPPWSFTAWSDKAQRHVTGHYSTMTAEEIYSLPVSEIADNDSVLFLWVTFPNLEQGLETIRRWGFTYKTCAFVWVKTNKSDGGLFFGMGYYTRSNVEVCLLATKGKPLPRVSHSVHSVVISPVQEHSRKPHEIRERIVKLFGDLPRIELFARQRVPGWDAWGLEADKDELPLFESANIACGDKQ